ncbi:MAG: hypothetical protein JHC87_08290 [Thermoleophilaceae bacterium]|nr:hypothetical protein [Thermoleophilaceae bacterium]
MSRISFGFRFSSAIFAALFVVMAMALAGCGDSGNDNTANVDEGPTPSLNSDEPGKEGYGAGPGNGYNDGAAQKNADGELVETPVQIGGGGDAGNTVGKNTVVVIRSQKQFDAIQKKIFSNGTKARPFAGTDFKTRQMYVVFLKPKPNGAATQITEVRTKNGKITVRAINAPAGEGCPGATKKTHPYSIVETKRIPGTAVVKIDNQTNPPC